MLKTLKSDIKIYLLACISLAATNVLHASDIDSLNNALKTLEGKEKVDVYIKLCDHYINNDARHTLGLASQCLELARSIEYREGVQQGLHYLAMSYYQLNDHENALKTYREEIEFIDVEKDPVAQIRILNNIGIIYEILADYENAINYHVEGLNLLKKYPDIELEAIISLNLGLDYSGYGAEDSTLKYMEASKQIVLSPYFNNRNIQTFILSYIAEQYYYLDNLEEAYKLINMAFQSVDKDVDKYTLSSVYLVLGKVYLKKGLYRDCILYFEETILLAQQIGQMRREIEARDLLAESYKKSGNYSQAFLELKKNHEIKDSTYTADKNRQILELEARYESEQSQKQIELLKRENAIKASQLSQSRIRSLFLIIVSILAISLFIFIVKAYKYKKKLNIQLCTFNRNLKRSKNQLDSLNSMKDRLIRLIGDDLKAPLGTVTKLSEVLWGKKQNYNPSKIKKLATQIYNSSIGMNHLLDNVLHWAKLQKGTISLSNSNFSLKESVIHGITPYHSFAEKKNVHIEIDIAEELIVFGDSLACSVIIGNLANNAIKYSYENSMIEITALKNNTSVQVIVKDFGVGMDKDTLRRLLNKNDFSSIPGTNNEKGPGFGLKISNAYLKQFGSQLNFHSELNKGTTISFELPIGT